MRGDLKVNQAAWPKVAFTDVATLVRREIDVTPEELYPEVGVRCFGKGLFHKPARTGLEVGDKSLFRLKEHDFILQVTFAWEGAVGVVKKADESHFGSVRVLTFEVDPDQALPDFLWRYFQTSSGVSQLVRISPGSAGRNRVLAVKRLPEITIPLPPLAEQQRLVRHLDAIETRLTHLTRLREEQAAEARSLEVNLAHRWDLSPQEKANQGWQETSLAEVMTQSTESVLVDTSSTYPNLGLLNHGRGTFSKPPIEGSTTSAPRLYQVRHGQFIYSRLFAFEGSYGLVAASQDGYFVSNEFPSFDLNPDRILPAFIGAYFKSENLWQELSSQASGLGDRRQRIHPDVLLNHRLLLPPLAYQQQISQTLSRLHVSQTVTNEVTACNQALIPSLLDRIFTQ
jgi:type I restriction enzyme, S subunit